MDYKVGDKVLYKDGDKLLILAIKKISKDGTMFLSSEDKDRYFSSVLSTEEELIKFIRKQFEKLSPNRSFYGLSILETDKSCWGRIGFLYGYGKEDKYDDVYHLILTNDYIRHEGKVFDAKSKDDVPDVYEFGHINGRDVAMTRTAELAAEYIFDKISDIVIERKTNEEQNLLDKYNDWLEKNDYFSRDKIPTDWDGGTKQLVYAIESNISPKDYDTWQAVEQILGFEISFDSAAEIAKILEKEGMAI